MKGQQRTIPKFGQHKGVKLLGTLDDETGDVFCIEEEKYDAVIFLEFLTKVLEHCSSGKVVMIWMMPGFTMSSSCIFFWQRDRLEIVFLPSYSPWLNLIEGLWKWLEESVIHNIFFSNIQKSR